MSSPALPPNPCLIAIIIVVKTTSEPRVLFHFPPQPGEDNSQFKNIFKEPGDDTSTTSSEDGGESSLEDRLIDNGRNMGGENGQGIPEDESASPEKNNGLRSSQNTPRWNDIFGFQSGILAKLLCPAATSHKKRFELGLRDEVFLGWPVYARPEGGWKKKKTKKKRARRSSSRSNTLRTKSATDGEKGKKTRSSTLAHAELSETSGQDTDNERRPGGHQNESQSRGIAFAEKESIKSKLSSNAAKKLVNPATLEPPLKEPLAMFHIVFVLRPPPLEYKLRVKEMYDSVVKKLSKALKWEQARSNYVAKEASTITSTTKRMIKASGENLHLATLYHNLLSQSGLARAVSTLFDNISASKIAHISLTPDLSLSLQIPILTSISVLPSPLEPHLPGLWLTTATTLPSDDDVQSTGSQLGSHFTLLLLSDLHTILADVNTTDSPITGPLTHYLRVLSPTKSFYKISQSSGIPLPDIQFLASHLIYWRRAQAIPPLHQWDTYILSPNADMRNLVSATSSFAKAFPTLPSLPRILSRLSTPGPYSTLIPSKDHKEAYLKILAWLLRGGWVTQLRSFAWVRVPPHVKQSVLEADEAKENGNTLPEPDLQGSIQSKLTLGVPQIISSSPTSSTGTVINTAENRSLPFSSLITNPRLASALPSRYLSAISTRIGESQGADSQGAWDKCVKYFDGKHAIETIAVREGWKRKKIADLVADWEALGVLVKNWHW